MIETVFCLDFFKAALTEGVFYDALVLIAVLAEANSVVKLAGAILRVLEVHAIATSVNDRAGVLHEENAHIFILRSVA